MWKDCRPSGSARSSAPTPHACTASRTVTGSEQAVPDLALLMRAGTVVDGSGLPPYTADVAIAAGRIVAVGRAGGANAARVVDADGCVVAPGFVDIHTHYDAQLHFEPT